MDACELSVAGQPDTWTAQEHTYLSRARLQDGIKPKFRFRIDGELLANSMLLQADEIEVVISARDLEHKRYAILNRWPLDQLPAEWGVDDDSASPLKSHGGFDFAIIASLVRARERTSNMPYRPASVLAKKIFSVRAEADALTFPIKFMDFAGADWPRDALWVINYFSEDPDYTRPVAEILELWVNKDAEQKLLRFSSAPIGQPFMQLMAADVFHEVAMRMLQEPEPESNDDDSSTWNQVIQSLKGITSLEAAQLRDMAVRDAPRLRAYVQAMYGVSPSVEFLEVRRL
jgi:hypothetical protein